MSISLSPKRKGPHFNQLCSRHNTDKILGKIKVYKNKKNIRRERVRKNLKYIEGHFFFNPLFL